MIRARDSGEIEMKNLLMQFVKDTEGQDLIEYALLAATIAIALVAAMALVKNALNTEFSTIAASVTAS
jgi:pilus assembly protein Flp/PilA